MNDYFSISKNNDKFVKQIETLDLSNRPTFSSYNDNGTFVSFCWSGNNNAPQITLDIIVEEGTEYIFGYLSVYDHDNRVFMLKGNYHDLIIIYDRYKNFVSEIKKVMKIIEIRKTNDASDDLSTCNQVSDTY